MSNTPFHGTLTVSAVGDAVQDVVFADDSYGQEVTWTYRTSPTSIVEQRVRWRLRSESETASDCTWEPSRTLLQLPFKVGMTWESSATCSDKTPQGIVRRSSEETAEVVRNDAVTVDGQRVPVVVIKRRTVERFDERRNENTIEDWYAPSLGCIVKQSEDFTSPDAASFAQHSTSEWWVTHRA